MKQNNMLAMILAGGRGSRLHELTNKVAKPAVSYGGKYRIIDFKRNKKDGIPATVIGIEYDPNRTANIALICYADGEKAYILAPAGLKDGMKVMSGAQAEAKIGNCLPLSEIPVGAQIHNIELYPGKGGQLVRSAGNSAQLMAKEGKYATLRLPSERI